MKKTIFPLLLIGVLFVAGCGEEMPKDQQIDYEEVQELIQETNDQYKVRGSCNVIDESSTCLDYVGSFWTKEQMTLNCQGVGAFSENTCPYTTVGGCQAGAGSFVETILWSYNYGGELITPENEIYASGACNANPAGQWVTPDQINNIE